MSDELNNEMIEVTETEVAEDVKEGLSATDVGVIGGIMLGGVLVFEGGKWVWKKTAGARSKIANGAKKIFSKKDKSADATDLPDQEAAPETAAEVASEKKSESKKGNSKK